MLAKAPNPQDATEEFWHVEIDFDDPEDAAYLDLVLRDLDGDDLSDEAVGMNSIRDQLDDRARR
mgnify:CR=1 FL=1